MKGFIFALKMYKCRVNISEERFSCSSKSVAKHSRSSEPNYIFPSYDTNRSNNNMWQRIATRSSWSCFSFCSLPSSSSKYLMILASNLSNLKEQIWHNPLKFLKQIYGRTWLDSLYRSFSPVSEQPGFLRSLSLWVRHFKFPSRKLQLKAADRTEYRPIWRF